MAADDRVSEVRPAIRSLPALAALAQLGDRNALEELLRGFDVLELEPSDLLSKNEIEAAKLVRFEQYNPQTQPRIEWPAAFPVIRSYLDQLVRGNGLTGERTTAIARALDAAEQQTGRSRREALKALARLVDSDVTGAKDPERVKAMSAAIKDLATATR